MNITATLGNRGQVLQVHAGSAKAAVGMAHPLVCPPGFLLGLSPSCLWRLAVSEWAVERPSPSSEPSLAPRPLQKAEQPCVLPHVCLPSMQMQ